MKRLAVGLVAALAYAQATQPTLRNGELESRPAAGDLKSQFQSLVAQQTAPVWIGYTMPLAPRNYRSCDWGGWNGWQQMPTPTTAYLEGPREFFVLFRIENRQVDRIRQLTPDCAIDAGGLKVIWLTAVKPADSIALLAGMDKERSARSAIGLHADPGALPQLEKYLARDQSQDTRRKAAQSLGYQGRAGLELIERFLRDEQDEKVREGLVQGIASSDQPEALSRLMEIVRTDKNMRVRQTAMHAISRSKDPRAQSFVDQILTR
jgi:hypothetical protein